ncbi:uncharacterized protein KY384_002250 [Bacidia gigantensis]|uniref:uncharacterized protein n=1 Tax=Bacidia gigantensis TaxID=2732470 RepID=UPI001D04E4E6|nr:uncharacterized protein KY384_002250 [Bacidia gigantensis]KAG8533467.1 hypothetical protein KY384_002250 [Bacidia gigantensis]
MTELIRDTVFGHLVRLVTRNRMLQYMEEKDPSLWKQYLDRDQTRNMALFGHPQLTTEEQEQQKEKESPETPSTASDSTLPETPTERQPHRHQMHSTLTAQRVDTEKGRDLSMVSWWGDNDPEVHANSPQMPMNWSTFKKVLVTSEICLLTTSVYIGSAIYTAGTESVVKTFGVSEVAATLGLTLFVAGYGLGPMIWAPMSEIPQFGRNPIYIGTLAVFVILQVPTALAVNFGMLLAFRFITGFIGSPVLATGGASMGDMYTPKKRAYAIGIWGISAVCGPVLGPLIGGFAVQAEDWTWTIWELMWLCGFTLVLLVFFLPETSSTNILYRRTKRLRKLTGIETLRCQPEIEAENMTGKDVSLIPTGIPHWKMLTFTRSP